MPTPQPPAAPAEPSDHSKPFQPPATPRPERTAARAFGALAALAWPTAFVLVISQDATRSLDPTTFAIATSWAILLGGLGLGVALLRPRDPLAAWEHGLGHRDRVRRLLAHAATACWTLSFAYTVTMGAHLYHLPLVAGIFTLLLPLALAVKLTVIVLVAPAKTRIETAFHIAHGAGEQLRAERRIADDAARLAASVALDEAEFADEPRSGDFTRRHGLHAVGGGEYPRHRPQQTALGRDTVSR